MRQAGTRPARAVVSSAIRWGAAGRAKRPGHVGLRGMAHQGGWRRARTWAGTFTWRRGRLLALLPLLVTALLVLHRYVPDQFGNAGSLMESFLPWLGAAV